MLWLVAAVFSAFFAGITTILAKCGIRNTDSDLVTALRTVVVFLGSWFMVLLVGSAGSLSEIRSESYLFLVLSGLSTGASWLCYFKALAIGDINKVVPIDKSSTVLTVLLAIVLFSEHDNLAIKLVATSILAIGIFLMVEKRQDCRKCSGNGWMFYAFGSAIFAALTSILAKIGIAGVESNLGTAIRTGVVLIMAWLVVFIKGEHSQIKNLNRRELCFIFLSGVSTCASWLCYYYAVQNGDVSVVVPIDKMGILVSVIFSYIVFKEKLSKKALLGLCLMLTGTLIMAICT